MKTELTTVPNFTFKQGDPFVQDPNCEYPIEVKFYNGTIAIEQEGNSVNLADENIDEFCKELKRQFKYSRQFLKK